MNFTLSEALPILGRTPAVLRTLLWDLPDSWTKANEGPDTWSPYDIVGHLIHGERTDWIVRTELLLEYGEERPFTPFDRFAQFEASRGKSLAELLDTFAELRAGNLLRLEAFNLTAEDFQRRGQHPELGPVTLEELLATWVAHDLSHIAQVARVMGRQYTDAVGPWRATCRCWAHRTGDREQATRRHRAGHEVRLLAMVASVEASPPWQRLEMAQDPELAELSQDVAPEKVMEKMEAQERV